MAASSVNTRATALARALLSRFIVIHAHRRRLQGGSAFGPSSDEVAQVLRGELGEMSADAASEDARVAIALAELVAAIGEDRDAPLARLARVFWLDKIDLSIIATLLAPELDPELERAFTFAIDDFTRKRLDIGFLGRLIGGRDEIEIDRAYARLDETAPLRRHNTLTLAAPNETTPTSMRTVRLADRIVSFLRGHDTID